MNAPEKKATGKLDFYGIGPKVARVLLPWFAVSIIITVLFRPVFDICKAGGGWLFYTGLGLLIFGFIFYFFTLKLLLRGLKETKLITAGAFSLCRNPLYTSFILLILPGSALMINSWIVLTSGLTGYLLFKYHISAEYREMEKFFGEEYARYSAATPEFFPLPPRKWFKQKAS